MPAEDITNSKAYYRSFSWKENERKRENKLSDPPFLSLKRREWPAEALAKWKAIKRERKSNLWYVRSNIFARFVVNKTNAVAIYLARERLKYFDIGYYRAHKQKPNKKMPAHLSVPVSFLLICRQLVYATFSNCSPRNTGTHYWWSLPKKGGNDGLNRVDDCHIRYTFSENKSLDIWNIAVVHRNKYLWSLRKIESPRGFYSV